MTHGELAFGAVRLHPQRREVGIAGVPLKLSSRGFDILLALLERPGELLGRRELIARVWHGRVVEDANLTVQVSQLRKRLGPDGDAIKTEASQGFRFVGDLRSTPSAMPAGPPALRAGAASTLPERLGVLVGREAALDTIGLHIEPGRLLTLLGPGGIGKTRLAIEAGRRSLGRFSDGALLLELAPLRSAEAIVSVLCGQLGLGAQSSAPALDDALRALRGRSLLVIFDNCEHLIEAAAAMLCRLVASCPQVAFLATSREALKIDAEHVFGVPPLALASPDAIARGEALRFPATQLFVDRVRSTRREFDATVREASAIARLCAQLDGNPLAIELAAGRASALGVVQVAARLRDGLRILSGGSRSSSPRHLTLQATLGWSYDLLKPAEQCVFRGLGAFPAHFSLDDAEAVLASNGLSDWDVVDGIDSLLSKSMLAAEQDDAGLVYRLLETTRVFALERLSQAGEADAVMRQLARHMAAIARNAEHDYRAVDRLTWVGRYGRALPNLRTVLEWAFGASGDAQLGIEIAVHAWPVWREAALVEGQRWIARAQARLTADTRPEVEALLWSARGWLLPNVRNPEAAENFRRAVDAFRRLGDELRLGEALRGLGAALSLTGRPGEGHPILEEAHSLLAKADAPCSLAACLESLGQSLYIEGRYDESRSFYDAALERFRAVGAERQAATVLTNLGDLAFRLGDIDGAVARVAAAAEQHRRLGSAGSHLAVALGNLAGYQVARGDLIAARSAAREALPLLASAGMAFWFFDHLAALAARLGDLSQAARFLGYADAAYAAQNDFRQPAEQQAYDAACRCASDGLEVDRRQDLMAAGASWSVEQALTHATEYLSQADHRAASSAPDAAPDTVGLA